jgi:hypothetical protein
MRPAAKWRVVLGALLVLALIGVPAGLVGAKQEPKSDKPAAASSDVESSEEGADADEASQTSTEEESSTDGEAAAAEDSSAEEPESPPAESIGGGESSSSNRQARTGQANGEPGNPPEVECGSDTYVKFGIGDDGQITDVEFNNPPFEEPVVTLSVVDAEARVYSYANTQTDTYTIFRIVLKAGQGSTNIENPPQSGTVDAPENISHITFCLTTEAAPPPPADITVDLVKDNDADEDETFTDSEEASEEGQDVTFQVVITNTSEVAVEILSLTDAFNETVIDPLECLTAGGQSVIGMVLDPDESVTCTFTVQDYAPPAGESLVDTVEVVVGEEGNEENQASDSDTSEVTSPDEGPPPPPPPADITVELVKDNDADEDGTFTDSEEASDEGQDVTFQVVITNTSDVAVEILSLSDAFGEFVFDPIACLTSEGENVIGMVLDPGESVTCTFTMLNYAPPAEDRLVDTVEVTVGEEGNEENQASDSDTSVVTTAEVLGGIVTPPRPGVQPPAQPGAQVAALAVTGAELAWMAFLAATLLMTGAVLIYTTQRRSRKQRA